MHTFYNPLLEDAFVTEMTPRGDEALLEEWKRQWHDMGWETRVLDLNDARRHPDYDIIKRRLDRSNLDGYNKMCIWRWLAMATIRDDDDDDHDDEGNRNDGMGPIHSSNGGGGGSGSGSRGGGGGGWAADYDLFPLWKDWAEERIDDDLRLPNDGELTVHDGNVPDLVSGRASEWLRMVHRITENLMDHVVPPYDDDDDDDDKNDDDPKNASSSSHPPSHNTKKQKQKRQRRYTFWSDMKALQEMSKKTPDMFQMDRMVMIRTFDHPDEGLGHPWTGEKCHQRTPSQWTMNDNGNNNNNNKNIVRAVHFSHASIKSAIASHLLHDGQTQDDRAAIASEWLETWRRSCIR